MQRALASISAAGLLLLAACDKKPDQPAVSSASAALAPKPPPTAKPTTPAPAPTASASASPTAAASASAEPTASAEPEPTGPVHIHLDSVKIPNGKSEGAEKTLKVNMLKLRTACVAPAIKKTPSFQGTLRVTLDVGDDGKPHAKAAVVTGKLPDELPSCVEKFYAEKVQLAPSRAIVEATILLGPKVSTDK